MNRAVLNRAVLDCAYVGTADVGGVGIMGALDEGEVQPYIKGHITNGSSIFTFKVNNQDITVPVDSNGNWRWVVDRTITSFKNAFLNKTNFDECYMYKVVMSGSCENMFNGCSKLKKLTLDNSISDTSYLYNFFYLTTTIEREVVIKNVLFDKCTSARFLFGNCNSVIGSNKLTFENCTDITRMFFNFNGETLDLSSADFTKVTLSGQAFDAINLQGRVSPLKNINIKKIGCDLNFSACPNLTAQSVVNLFNAVAADDIVLTFHQNVWNMIMREIDVQGSPIQVAYQNMIDNYDVTIANASFDAEIEYLEFSGTQYIDTGFKANTTTTRAETELQVTELTTNRGIFGSRNTSGTTDNTSCNVLLNATRGLRLDWIGGIANIFYENVTIGVNYVISITRGLVIINNEQIINQNTESVNQNYNFLIGNFSNAGTPFTNGFIGKFYWFKIYNNNQLVRDFIPVRKGTTGYLYDKVSGNLFGNSGTGDFVLGNDK